MVPCVNVLGQKKIDGRFTDDDLRYIQHIIVEMCFIGVNRLLLKDIVWITLEVVNDPTC